jgi:hypothetical protein
MNDEQGKPGSAVPHLVAIDEAKPFTVADMQAAVARLRELDGTTVLHGWDANGSPVEERVFLVDVHANSILGRLYREGRVHADQHGHIDPAEVARVIREHGDAIGDRFLIDFADPATQAAIAAAVAGNRHDHRRRRKERK